MAEVVIELLIAVPVVLLWLTVVSVLVRPFGVRLPWTPFSWAKQAHLLRAMPSWGLGSLSLAVQKVISQTGS